METIQQQIGALQVIVAKQQVSVKRQRFAIIALASVIVAGGFIAAVRPVGDATFDTIVCKKWMLIDEEGNLRIAAATNTDSAYVNWLDKNKKVRITAGTYTDGSAAVTWFDRESKSRILASTDQIGIAALILADKDKNIRIMEATWPDGTIALPTKDEKPPKKP